MTSPAVAANEQVSAMPRRVALRAAALAGLAGMVLVLFCGVAPTARADDSKAAQAFIEKLGDDAISFLSDTSLTPDQRATKFAALFKNKFAVESIARFVAGAAWRAGTEAEQKEYIDLFTNFVVNTYAQRLSRYSGEQLKVGAARVIDDSVVVSSEIVQKNGPPTKVDWRLRNTPDGFRILDVIIEGISMAITQRSDFAADARNGLGALIASLKKSRFSQ